jgi:nucleotide-binding universal stress UspA family protein
MSATAILFIGVFTVVQLAIFVYVSMHEIHASPPGTRPFHGLLPIQEHVPPIERPSPRAVRILLAIDGSPCSDRAVAGVGMRPWPAGSQVEVLSVVHTRMPAVPDPELMIVAAHVDAVAADRERAPIRVRRAAEGLADAPGLAVTSKIVEGDPADAILDEAEHWRADLIVVGSHGFGSVKRRLLGSVSQTVALHAPCSVEIVRCAREDAPREGNVSSLAGPSAGLNEG